MNIEIKNASITYVSKDNCEITINMEQNSKNEGPCYEFSSDYVKFEYLEDILELVEDFKSRIYKCK